VPSGYRGREMDEKARKEREDKKRRLDLQEKDLRIKERVLTEEKGKRDALLREIAKLENQTQISTTITAETALGTKKFEAQSMAKASENDNKILFLEKEIMDFEQKIFGKKGEIEKLKHGGLELGQKFETKKREMERASKDLFVASRRAAEHQKLIRAKNNEATKLANRINGLEQEVKAIQDRIQILQK
jgi:chromosome segregation ATPase